MEAKRSGYKVKTPDLIKRAMIAPCGMNCALCIGYLREKNRCGGCVPGNASTPDYCRRCVIRNCDKQKEAKRPYCFDCKTFPCARLKRLDKRYRTKYGMSMLDNLERIRESGIGKFVRNEKERWACGNCGWIVSVHRKDCLYCGRGKSAKQLSVPGSRTAG
jgi:ribosomal protein S27AE